MLSGNLFSHFACSSTFTLQSFQLLIGLRLLSSQLVLGHVEVLACVQPLELLASIVYVMLKRLDEDLISPGLDSQIPSMSMLQLMLSYSILSLVPLGTPSHLCHKLPGLSKFLLESGNFLFLVMQYDLSIRNMIELVLPIILCLV